MPTRKLPAGAAEPAVVINCVSSNESRAAAHEAAAVITWGGWTVVAGLGLIVAQLASEVFILKHFGPSYVGLFVVMIGAALMALGCITGRLQSKPQAEKAD